MFWGGEKARRLTYAINETDQLHKSTLVRLLDETTTPLNARESEALINAMYTAQRHL